jgi:predicted transcriptional regulator
MKNMLKLAPIMRKHNGMRPQDVAILLKIIAIGSSEWQVQALSNSLRISMTEISFSLDRSRTAGLIDFKKKRPNRQAVLEFVEHGVKYVFPVEPGRITRGIPTAHSHPAMKVYFDSEEEYVWPDASGKTLGQTIEPFYEKQAIAAKDDPVFYELLALSDVLRVGRVREVKTAMNLLRKQIVSHEPAK